MSLPRNDAEKNQVLQEHVALHHQRKMNDAWKNAPYTIRLRMEATASLAGKLNGLTPSMVKSTRTRNVGIHV